MEQAILVFAYYSYRDPIFQSAVLPYFAHFKSQHKIRFVLLTFDHDTYPMTPSEVTEIETNLLKQNIIWKRSRWRSGRFKILKKFLDFVSAVVYSIYLIRKFRINAIYSEGFPGSIITHYISLITGCKHMVHTFEPHADYMIEAGIWTEHSWEARFQRWHEPRIARHATYLFTATDLMMEKLKKSGISEKVLHRVPSCVDTIHFQFNPEARMRIRSECQVPEHEPVLVYLGKFGGMYMEGEAFDFFRECQTLLNASIMILTPEAPEIVERLITEHQVIREKVILRHLTRNEVPAYLSAADIGFVAVRQWPSKKYCSPIKTGEYLACGLPVIVPLGISDDPQLLHDRGIGILMKTLEKSSFLEVINEWKTWINTRESGELRKKARDYALEDRSVERYQVLYAQLFEAL